MFYGAYNNSVVDFRVPGRVTTLRTILTDKWMKHGPSKPNGSTSCSNMVLEKIVAEIIALLKLGVLCSPLEKRVLQSLCPSEFKPFPKRDDDLIAFKNDTVELTAQEAYRLDGNIHQPPRLLCTILMDIVGAVSKLDDVNNKK